MLERLNQDKSYYLIIELYEGSHKQIGGSNALMDNESLKISAFYGFYKKLIFLITSTDNETYIIIYSNSLVSILAEILLGYIKVIHDFPLDLFEEFYTKMISNEK